MICKEGDNMKLYINNIGIIKETEVKLEGLTVITGKNSSGKTTVGKTIYSLISAGSDLEEAFKNSKISYIYSQLTKVESVLKIRRYRRFYTYTFKDTNFVDEIISTLATRRYTRFEENELIAFLVATRDMVAELTPEIYKEQIIGSDNFENNEKKEFIDTLYEGFPEWKSRALEICNITIDLISDKKTFYRFLKDRTAAFLNHEFNKQIKPVRYKKNNSKIELYYQENCIVKAIIKKDNQIDFSEESSFIYPYDRAIFIDNPFIIDKLENGDDLYHSMYREYDEYNPTSIVSSDDIKDHDELLCRLLTDSGKKNFFDDVELQNKFKSVFEKINKIVPGEFSKTSDGYFYVNEGASLSVKNLATGSKMFFIIKKLLLNGQIDSNTMLILDEPESHLHPEWINKFAEILVFLVQNVNVNILLTTHSPNLMLALNVYAKKMNLSENSHFYLAEKMSDGYFSSIKCIDESIGEGFSHLSLPLVEMNLELEEIYED